VTAQREPTPPPGPRAAATPQATARGGAPDPDFRCSVASSDLEEPLLGSASTVRAFLLVEEPGPWGVDALRDSRLPEAVKEFLQDLQRRSRVRPLLVRRQDRRRPDRRQVFAAFVRGPRPWLEATSVADLREICDLDLSDLAEGTSPGLTPHPDPLFAVCTHGRHDACCAERGRPLCQAMRGAAPDEAWEVSHIGGDRFAANMLVLPHGLYYGRLTPADAGPLVRAHHEGTLDLAHLRGRCAYPFAVQAAEVYLRRHTGIDTVEPLDVTDGQREDVDTRVSFRHHGSAWTVAVRTVRGEPRPLTCRAEAPGRGLTHRLLGIEP
jgi:hypothetical protein